MRDLRPLVQAMTVTVPQTRDILKLANNNLPLVVAHEALKLKNKKIFRLVMEEAQVEGSSLKFGDYLGPELVDLLEQEPSLIYQWRALKELGTWRSGKAVLGNRKLWQVTATTQFGDFSFTLSPHSWGPAGTSFNIARFMGVTHEAVEAIVERVRTETTQQLQTNGIPMNIRATCTFEHPDEYSGTSLDTVKLKGRNDRTENLIVFAWNLRNALMREHP